MTQLEQYKKGYATLVGRVDKVIECITSRLEGDSLDAAIHPLTAGRIAEELTRALQDVEEIFLAEDPEDLEDTEE